MKDKKTILGLALVCVIGIVGASIAYFSSTDTFQNIFGTKTYKMEVVETFESPDDWTPGTTTPKTVVATNKGDVDAAVRVSFEEEWKDASNNPLPATDGNNHHAAIINFTSDLNKKWITSTEDGKTYYYYKAKIAKNESTPTLIESVTFNPALEIDVDHNCVTDSETHKQTCTSETSGYAGGSYKLTIKVETIQYDQYKNGWNTSVEILDEIPLPYTIQSGDIETAGSLISIGDQDFYVLGDEDSNHVKLLARYNLGSGHLFDVPLNKQNPAASGYMSNSGSAPFPGSIKYSESDILSDAPGYIYTNEKENGLYKNNIAEHIDNYIDYLSTFDVNVTGRLIRKDEIELIVKNGQSIETQNMSTFSDIQGKEWIYSTSYWTGNVGSNGVVYFVASDGMFGNYKGIGYDYNGSFGIRPVIILEK